MISDDDLLLYYYRDGLDAVERARIGTALAERPELAQRLHRLVAQLDTVAEMAEVPVPAHIEQRWQSALDRAAHSDVAAATTGSRFRAAFFRWQTLAATVAAIAVLVTIQVSMQPRLDRVSEATPPASTPSASTPDVSAYERGLKWHLANTEQRLASLESAQPDERARLIEAIIEQNRLYALAAERANEPQLARVLRGFTPILESLANERRDADASDVAQLNFELRVVQGRLNAAADTSSTAQSIAL
jgi:anti-sigma factor RsiW